MKTLTYIFYLMTAILSFSVGISKAQDKTPMLLDFNPLTLDPTTACKSKEGCISLSYVRDMPSFSSVFETYSISYYQPISSVRGGIAAEICSDNLAGGLYRTLIANLYLSHYVNLNRYNTLSFAIKTGYNQQYVDYDNLVFGDQLLYDLPISQENLPSNDSPDCIDFGAGLSWTYMSNTSVAISIDHVNAPSLSFYDNDSVNMLHPKFTAMAQTTYNVSRGSFGEGNAYDFVVAPTIAYQRQSQYQCLHLQAEGRIHNIFAGIGYRHRFAQTRHLMIFAGLAIAPIRIGYGCNITYRPKGSIGSHEVALSWHLGNKKNKKNTIKPTCF